MKYRLTGSSTSASATPLICLNTEKLGCGSISRIFSTRPINSGPGPALEYLPRSMGRGAGSLAEYLGYSKPVACWFRQLYTSERWTGNAWLRRSHSLWPPFHFLRLREKGGPPLKEHLKPPKPNSDPTTLHLTP